MAKIPSQPGIYYGLSFEDYCQIPGLNATTLKWALVSGKHLEAAMMGKLSGGDSKAKAFGRALHAVILEPDTFTERFKVSGPCQEPMKSGKRKGQPCGSPGRAQVGGVWKCGKHVDDRILIQWEREASDAILTPDEYQRVLSAQSAIEQDPITKLLRQSGACEATVIWEDEGVRCKARLDKWIPEQDILPATIVDIKKVQAGEIDDETIEWAIYRWKYDFSAAWYRRGVEKIIGYKPEFVWIFQEDSEPYLTNPLQADAETLTVGSMRCSEAFGKYLIAKAMGEFQGLPRERLIRRGGLPQPIKDRYLAR